MVNIICGENHQPATVIEMPTPVKNVGHFVFFFKFLTKWGFL
jgi:hypothetical protein